MPRLLPSAPLKNSASKRFGTARALQDGRLRSAAGTGVLAAVAFEGHLLGGGGQEPGVPFGLGGEGAAVAAGG